MLVQGLLVFVGGGLEVKHDRDATPQAVLDRVDLDALKEEYGLYSAMKNGPRLWCLHWVEEVMVGKERDFNGLRACHLC